MILGCAVVLWKVLVGLAMAMLAIAQRISDLSDVTDEHVPIPHGQLTICLLSFFAVLWAIGAKKGPLREWPKSTAAGPSHCYWDCR